MTDTRYWSKEFLSEFIEIYKNQPCLWKIKSKEYTNKNAKCKAYDALVVHCRKIFPEANRDFVTKKIQSIRGSFRKEFHKISNSKRSGAGIAEVYKPSLWYYDLLKFTTEQEELRVNSLHSDEDSHLESVTYSGDAEMRMMCENEDIEVQERSEETRQSVSKDMVSNISKKRKKKKLACIEELMEVCKNALQKSTDMMEYEGVGISVSKKLQRMDPTQALHAESLVNEVLKRGLLNKLTENTDIYERPAEAPTTPSIIPKPEFAQESIEALRKRNKINKISFEEHPGPSWEEI